MLPVAHLKPFIHRIVIQNYKSIARCDLALGPFTLLVGPNGAGKSNFLDALGLISDSLQSTLEYGLRLRGGIKEVRRKSLGHPTHFGLSLWLTLPDLGPAHYAFRIGASSEGGFVVQREMAEIPRRNSYFETRDGRLVRKSENLLPNVLGNSLYLTAVSGNEAFYPLFRSLSTMGFYNINPAIIREPQSHDSGTLLHRDGSNLAGVLKRMREKDGPALERVKDYLRQICPGIQDVDYLSLGPKETLEFKQDMQGARHPWRFYASNTSDGTLRALGVLAALFQSLNGTGTYAPLIGIEEPEVAIHPGAAAVLLDALLEASRRSQVVVTTHSPELLDHRSIEPENIVSVDIEDGETLLAPCDPASVNVIKSDLYTAGELLRTRQLQPDTSKIPSKIGQLDLFRTGTFND